MDSFVERPAVDGGLGISSLSSLPPRPSPAVLYGGNCKSVPMSSRYTPLPYDVPLFAVSLVDISFAHLVLNSEQGLK